MSQSPYSLNISISQLPSPKGMNDYLQLVTHIAQDGGYCSIAANRYAPTEWIGFVNLEGVHHRVLGESVDEVVHRLADRVGAI